MEFSGTTVGKFVGEKIEVAVPREQIQAIKLIYDTSARYPFLQFFVGFILLALGAIGVIVLVLTSLRGSLPIAMESGELGLQPVPTALWLMVALGLWSLIGVLRASYHLEIETQVGAIRMFLGKSTDLPDIRRFIRRASWNFGYEIDISVLDRAPGLPEQP